MNHLFNINIFIKDFQTEILYIRTAAVPIY